MRVRRCSILAALMFSLPAIQPLADQTDVIYDNRIAAPVENVPMKPTRFTLYDSTSISSIQTFHWNRGAGAAPGSIALQGSDKRLIGPWKAQGIADEQGLANAYWEVEPNLVLQAGTYTVLDSDPASWSRNPAKGNVGIVRITGRKQAPESVKESGVEHRQEQPPATNPAASGDSGAVVTAEPLLTPEQQQLRADELFEQIRQADNYDYQLIEALYLQLLRECPDTEQAEESYFRLSNLYRLGMDPPAYAKLRELLERYLSIYPDSEMAPEMRQRLRRAYEDTGQWTRVVELYADDIAGLGEEHRYYPVTLLDYARALEGSGNRVKAHEIYREVARVTGGESAGRYDMSEFWLRAAQDRIAIIGLIDAKKWPELAQRYRTRFSNIAFAEMPQIQELLEYAEALEQIGERSEAIKQYRQVLRTDQGNATLQAARAGARLTALVGTSLYE